MSIPNTAIAFPQTAIDSIAAKISETKALFPVLATEVGPSERKSLQVIAVGREPYVLEAYTDATNNLATVPGTVNLTTWALLEQQATGLDETESLLMSLLDSIRATKAVTNDARYENVRRYYHYLQDGLDKLPGAKVIYDKISRLYASQGKRVAKTTPAAAGGK